jgi:hypothetical protein
MHADTICEEEARKGKKELMFVVKPRDCVAQEPVPHKPRTSTPSLFFYLLYSASLFVEPFTAASSSRPKHW